MSALIRKNIYHTNLAFKKSFFFFFFFHNPQYSHLFPTPTCIEKLINIRRLKCLVSVIYSFFFLYKKHTSTEILYTVQRRGQGVHRICQLICSTLHLKINPQNSELQKS